MLVSRRRAPARWTTSTSTWSTAATRENSSRISSTAATPKISVLWNDRFPDGVGDFAQIWEGLHDLDPCVTNYSPQVAFIDDGVVVPGTGGSRCINWCYGPGGYIVTTTGGLAGPRYHIHNAIESPVMAWPAPRADPDPMTTASSWPSMCIAMRTVGRLPGYFLQLGCPLGRYRRIGRRPVQDIAEQGCRNRTSSTTADRIISVSSDDVTDLMNPGRDEVQVQLRVYELGWLWYWTGNDGYPAPYFDNVTVKIFPHRDPVCRAREMDLAQDNFPAAGTIDFEDLGSHSVRFDMANNISLAAHMRNDPGDSIVVDIAPVRAGADLDRPIPSCTTS